MTDTVNVKGLDQVLKNLKGLSGDLKRKGLISGARAGANLFKREIKNRAPHDTGALKKSISTRQMSKRLKDIVGAMVTFRTGNSRTQKQKNSGIKDAWYWFLQEYGWHAGGRWRKRITSGEKLAGNTGLTRDGFRAKNKRERKKIKGKRFVKKSFDAKKDSVLKSYLKSISNFIGKYRGK